MEDLNIDVRMDRSQHFHIAVFEVTRDLFHGGK